MSDLTFQFVAYCSAEYYEMVSLRQLVLRTPLGLHLKPADLERENDNLFLGCYENHKLIACCLLKKLSKDEMKIRQVAVLPGMQGKNLGKQLMQFAENFSLNEGCRLVSLHARFNVVDFYKKLGYTTVGEAFEEIGILHYKMEKVL